MTNLSVNINKIATLRNARGENNPDVVAEAQDCERFGAQGITVHPRPDERHIRRSDVYALRPVVKTEFNMEGNPTPEFIDLVLAVKPEQVTLVPDPEGALTSNAGWDVEKNFEFLSETVDRFKEAGIRTSIFVAPDDEQIRFAARTGADRVELYTKPYADLYAKDPAAAVAPYAEASRQRRTRPKPQKPGLLPHQRPLPQRGIHRSRPHLRRPLPGPGGDNKAVPQMPLRQVTDRQDISIV